MRLNDAFCDREPKTRPSPFSALAGYRARLTNFSKTRGRTSAGMPGPSSVTRSTTASRLTTGLDHDARSFGRMRNALFTTLPSACSIRMASAWIIGSSAGKSSIDRQPRPASLRGTGHALDDLAQIDPVASAIQARRHRSASSPEDFAPSRSSPSASALISRRRSGLCRRIEFVADIPAGSSPIRVSRRAACGNRAKSRPARYCGPAPSRPHSAPPSSRAPERRVPKPPRSVRRASRAAHALPHRADHAHRSRNPDDAERSALGTKRNEMPLAVGQHVGAETDGFISRKSEPRRVHGRSDPDCPPAAMPRQATIRRSV